MLDTARDFEALEQLRIDTPNLAAGLRWLLASDHVQDVLAFFDDADLDRPRAHAVRVARRARPRRRRALVAPDQVPPRGTSPRSVSQATVPSRLETGTVKRNRRGGPPVDAESTVVAAHAMGVAMRDGAFERSVAIGRAAIERARQEGDRRRLVVLLCLTALGANLVDVPQALAHAEEAVANPREAPQPRP